MFENIRLILVGPQHGGNIGATARAMKNMGVADLHLVNPKDFPSVDANVRACGADDILARAVIHQSLEQALADCHLVIATSARARYVAVPNLQPAELSDLVLSQPSSDQIAIVFGCERVGLTNQELAQAHYQFVIPTVDEFSSLNLAQAVQVIVYELYRAYDASRIPMEIPNSEPVAMSAEVEGFYQHLQQVIVEIGFTSDENSAKLMRRIRRLYGRARLEKKEVNILRGILTAVQRSQAEDT